MEKIKIVEIPAGRMISSGGFDMGDETMERFVRDVLKAQAQDIFPRDFMWGDPVTQKTYWYVSPRDRDMDARGFEVVDFEGGYYAVATAIDPDDGNTADVEETIRAIEAWVRASGCFALDYRDRRQMLSHMPAPQTKAFMGYAQLEVFVPVKVIGKAQG